MPIATDAQLQDPQSLSLAKVARRCQDETTKYHKRQADYDPRYGYELFRRAIQERDKEA